MTAGLHILVVGIAGCYIDPHMAKNLASNLHEDREPITALAWKNIALRHKQAYLPISWATTGDPAPFLLIDTSETSQA